MAEDIANRQLTRALIPPADADFDAIEVFANSYPGYAVWGTQATAVETGQRVQQLATDSGPPASLTKLRTALFAAAREAHYASSDIDVEPIFGPPLRELTEAAANVFEHGPRGHLTMAAALASAATVLSETEGSVKERDLRIALGVALDDALSEPVASSATGHEETFAHLPFWADTDPPGPFDLVVGPPNTPRIAAEVKWSSKNTLSHCLWDVLKLLAVLSWSAEQVYLVAGFPRAIWHSSHFACLFDDGVLAYSELPLSAEWPSLLAESKGTPTQIPNAIDITEVARVALIRSGEPWELRAVALDPSPGGWLEVPNGSLEQAWPLDGQ